MILNPEFMTISNQGDGSTLISAQADEDIWERDPYVCLIDAYLDLSWNVARPNDFIFISIMGLDFKSSNSAPEIRGLDDEFSVIFGETVEGSF